MISKEKPAIVDRYSKEELKLIVKDSFSIKEVLRKLGYASQNGRNSDTLSRRLSTYGISTSHFRVQTPEKRNEENVFCKGSTASQATLRRWYIKQSDSTVCEICKQANRWNGGVLTMILDHKNGDHHDNRKENLRWICPNCNSQLPTFAGRNNNS